MTWPPWCRCRPRRDWGWWRRWRRCRWPNRGHRSRAISPTPWDLECSAASINGNRIGGNGTIDADTITGGAGTSTLFGELGNDLIIGGSGNEKISGGFGYDTVTGGGGTNAISFDRAYDTYVAGGGYRYRSRSDQLHRHEQLPCGQHRDANDARSRERHPGLCGWWCYGPALVAAKPSVGHGPARGRCGAAAAAKYSDRIREHPAERRDVGRHPGRPRWLRTP